MTQSPSPAITPVSNARCPRCGYDQRGPVATWKEQCPLQGTCSECGLVFNWAEVLMPEKFEPRWCVEFVPRKRSIPLASVKTFRRSFNPWKFWSRMQMSQRVRKRRLALYGLLLLTPFILIYLAVQMYLAIRMHRQVQAQYVGWTMQMTQAVASHQERVAVLQAKLKWHSMTDDEQNAFLAGLSMQAFRNQAEVRTYLEQDTQSDDEVSRMIQSTQQWIATAQAQAASGPVVQMPAWLACVEMVFLPLSRASSGWILFADGTMQPYPAPVHVYQNLLPWTAAGRWTQLPAVRNIGGGVSALLLTLLLPATFILLPASRRRAKVRWIHVVRILVYSLFAFVTLTIVLIVFGVLYAISDVGIVGVVAAQAPLVFWLTLPVWWGVAIKRYLKMPHAAAVAGLMTLILALLMSPLLTLVFPQWIMRMILN